MTIKLIACVDINNAISDADGNLLFNLPKDMRHFKSLTSRKHVVMGRKTWKSLPKKPLPNRKNYVLTMDESFEAEGATVLHSIEEVLELGKKQDVWIIGGGEIYYQTIDFADELYITHVHHINFDGRVFFPDIDVREWKLESTTKHEADKNHAHNFVFATYKKKED